MPVAKKNPNVPVLFVGKNPVLKTPLSVMYQGWRQQRITFYHKQKGFEFFVEPEYHYNIKSNWRFRITDPKGVLLQAALPNSASGFANKEDAAQFLLTVAEKAELPLSKADLESFLLIKSCIQIKETPIVLNNTQKGWTLSDEPAHQYGSFQDKSYSKWIKSNDIATKLGYHKTKISLLDMLWQLACIDGQHNQLKWMWE